MRGGCRSNALQRDRGQREIAQRSPVRPQVVVLGTGVAMLTKLEASSVGDVLEAVRKLRATWNPLRGAEELWFRGDSKARSLVPSLYRPYELNCRYDEVTLFESVMAPGASINPNTVDRWDWYGHATPPPSSVMNSRRF